MSPHPSITAPPAPLLPRQTYDPSDPYGISSMMASLSALYPDLYSDFSYSSYDSDFYSSYYSSLLSEYASLTEGLSNMYTTNDPTATGAPGASRTGVTGAARATGVEATSPDRTGGGGLSSGAKIGIGVGVTLGVMLLAGIGILIWCMGKRKGKQTSTTVVAPAQPPFNPQQQQPLPPQQFQQPQPQMGYVNNQGYMQGYPQQSVSPPPQYPQGPGQQQNLAAAYGGVYKQPDPNVAELEHEYHFAKPGVVEMDGMPDREQNGRR